MRSGLVVAAGAALLVTVRVPLVSAQLCVEAMPPRIELAQGHAFIATLKEAEPQGPDGIYGFDYVFDVERVIVEGSSGASVPVLTAGQATHIGTANCGPVENLSVGHRYLVTTSDLVAFPAFYSLVWEVSGDTATLVRMYDGQSWDYPPGGPVPLDQRFQEAKTVDAAIHLITQGSLPQTDAVYPSEPRNGHAPWPALIAAGLAVLAAFGLWRRIHEEGALTR